MTSPGTPLDHLDDDRAQRFVDGVLPEEERAACAAHLEACAGCGLVVESYRALGDALAGLELPPPPPDFTEAVLARVDARERASLWERRLAGGILGLAACCALAAISAAGASAWAPVLGRASDVVGEALTAMSIGAGVLGPVVRALRVQIVVLCAVLGLPILFALSRLVPRRAGAIA